MSLSSLEKNLSVLRISEFQNPPKIIFGVGAVDRVGEEAKRLGGGSVLVVSDGNIEKAGILGKVLKLLEEKELDTKLYKIPIAEPTLDSTRVVADMVRQEKYDVVIGVGGGSCMDSAKVAAAMATNPGDVWEYCAKVEGEVKMLKNKTLLKILIPTTAGTGSEASPYSVIIEKEYKTWIADSIYADVAIVDPTMTLTLPPRMTAGSGLDALSHVVEALMSVKTNPISDALSLEAVRLIFRNLRVAYHQGEDLEARWSMSLAATFGGWVIGFPWIAGPAILAHCIAEALGSKYNIPHGVACAIALPYVMEYNLPASMERLGLITAATGEDTTGLTKREVAFKSVDAVFELMEDVDLPTSLREVNVPKEDLKPFAEYLINKRQYLYNLQAFNPRKPTLENITELMERMWEGNIE